MKKMTLLFLFLLSFSAAAFGQNNAPGLNAPCVDKRVELLSIVFRLAGNFEYNMDQFKEYVNDIHNHFDKYKEHPAVLYARKMADSNNVGFDAVADFAVHIEQAPSFKPVVPFTENIPDPRWTKQGAETFTKLLKDFYADAKCEEFFSQHAELYKLAEERFNTVFTALDISWYKKYFGVTPSGSFNIFIGLGNGGCNYASKVVFPGGREDAYATMGTWSTDKEGKPVYSADGYLPTLIHEFNHSFANQLIDKYKTELEIAGKKLFEPVEYLMKSQAYSEWTYMMYEALVRASVIRYMKDHNQDTGKETLAQIGNGYVWMNELVESLGYYEDNRDKYPTLESYMPRIVDLYNDLAKNSTALFKRCGHVLTIEPMDNNAVNVPSQIREMRINFDKPMTRKGISIIYGPLGVKNFPIVNKDVRFTEDMMTLILNIDLKPDTVYQFELTGQGFKTADGYPLLNYKVEFKTK